MNKFDINKIPKNILDNYNISEFDNPSEAFNFLFDEDFTKEDIISMLSDEMKDELVRQNDNIRKCNDKYYYCSIFMKEKMVHVFQDKMSKKDIVFSTMEENIGIFPLSIDNEKIIGITDDDWMPLSSLMNAKNANISNQEILKELTDNSNPILVKYYFK